MHALMLQPDGKILIGGDFTSFNGTARSRVARLNSDGALDPTFDPGSGASAVIRDIALQLDGKVIVAGEFVFFNGALKMGVARLSSIGILESGFNVDSQPNENINEVRVLSSGKLLIAGEFFMSGVFPDIRNVERLTPNGEIDLTFDGPDSFPVLIDEDEGAVTTMALQADGDILIGGTFCAIDGVGRNRIARLKNVASTPLSINLSVLLDGLYDAGALLMSDQLRTAGLLPSNEPYTSLGYQHIGSGGGEVLQSAALSITGNNAIVDWVVVELRASLNTVWMSQSALLQRDGGVKGMDGLTSISFTTPPGPYYVAVRHRNHLGVMTATPITLSVSTPTLNFTSTATTTYGTAAQKQVDSKMLMWAGDATGNGVVKYTGTTNDRDPLLVAVGSTTPNNALTGQYSRLDTNLDGVVKYTGSANDRDVILTTVGSTTPANSRTQQLP
jgi:uncharacterized delta-60 repeat protein